MRRLKESAGLTLAGAILLLVLLVMFEVTTFPSAHHWMGYVVLGYLFMIMACLTGEILRDLWRWFSGE